MPLGKALAVVRDLCEGAIRRDRNTDAALASPLYVSPEQVRGKAVDERSDVYALGAILYHLLAGEPPFIGATTDAVMEMRLRTAPAPLHELVPSLPTRIDRLAARCLAVNPVARFASLVELRAEIDGAMAAVRSGPGSRRFITAMAACVLSAGLAYGATVLWHLHASHSTARSGSAAVAQTGPGSDVPQVGSGSGSDLQVRPGGSVVVLVTAIENRSADPLFDGTLDQAIELVLRRSSVVDPISGFQLHALAAELTPDPPPAGSPPGEVVGKKLAARDHTRVVIVRGAVTTKDAGFTIMLTATNATDGAVVLDQTLDVAAVDHAIPMVALFANSLRTALGEQLPADNSEAEHTGLSNNIEAVHEMAIGRSMILAGNLADAVPHLQHVLALDPAFAYGHVLLGFAYIGLDRLVDGGEQNRAALRGLDQLGERDRLTFLGNYYEFSTGEYDRSVAAFAQLLKKWPNDQGAEVSLSDVYMSMRDLPKALEAARRAARDHSRDLVTRINLAAIELDAGNFEASLVELDKITHEIPHPLAQVQLYYGLAYLLSGDREKALGYFDKYAQQAPGFGPIAKADLALSESRLGDAEKLLDAVIASAASADAAQLAHVLLAETRLRRGDAQGALASATKVAKESSWLFFAALTELAAGDEKDALETAQRLDKDAAIGPRVMTKWLYGELARVHKKPDEAIAAFRESVELNDAWFGHYLLARAYLDARKFSDANHELEICLARQGEGSSVFFDDLTSLRFLSTVPYYLGRAQEGLGNAHASASFKAFLATQNGEDHDPMVEDAKKRIHH